tara:strand:+ start:3588 stop:4013 length:426 start_codon:yes stop_codon:yes gene_type:complete
VNENKIEWTPESMLEVSLSEPDDFLKIKETLTRIGVASKRDSQTLFQSCHILHKQGRYFIVHFKELFMLDGKPSNFSEEDLARRNTIATLLSDWGLLDVLNTERSLERTSLRNIKIISHRDKNDWNLEAKYSIGNVKINKE